MSLANGSRTSSAKRSEASLNIQKDASLGLLCNWFFKLFIGGLCFAHAKVLLMKCFLKNCTICCAMYNAKILLSALFSPWECHQLMKQTIFACLAEKPQDIPALWPSFCSRGLETQKKTPNPNHKTLSIKL